MRSVFLYKPRPETAQRRLTWFLRVWGPALLGVGVIICESTATFSAANTSSWLRPVVEALFGHLEDQRWAEVHHLIRKSGHFIGYGSLCLLFLRSWLLTLADDPALAERGWRVRSILAAIVCTAVVAGGDELHQSFLPSRTGLFSDVVLDTCGGMTLTAVCLGLSWLLRLRDERRYELLR